MRKFRVVRAVSRPSSVPIDGHHAKFSLRDETFLYIVGQFVATPQFCITQCLDPRNAFSNAGAFKTFCKHIIQIVSRCECQQLLPDSTMIF